MLQEKKRLLIGLLAWGTAITATTIGTILYLCIDVRIRFRIEGCIHWWYPYFQEMFPSFGNWNLFLLTLLGSLFLWTLTVTSLFFYFEKIINREDNERRAFPFCILILVMTIFDLNALFSVWAVCIIEKFLQWLG